MKNVSFFSKNINWKCFIVDVIIMSVSCYLLRTYTNVCMGLDFFYTNDLINLYSTTSTSKTILLLLDRGRDRR